MKIVHMLALGGAGGIETLCVDIAKHSHDENHFYFMWGGGENAEKIKSITHNVVIRAFSLKKFRSEYKFFKKYCVDNKIDCVMVQGMSPAMLLFAAFIKQEIPTIKFISYIHANADELFKIKKQKVIFKYAYKYVDGCIAISDSVNKSIKDICGDNSKVYTIYNGVDVDKFIYTKRENVNIPPKLIFVGRLISQKGVSLLIRALGLLKMDCELHIIGDGPERGELESLTKELNLQSKVYFAGTQWDINERLQNSDIFVHSAVCNEGFGLTLIEAMATGVPCIAFNKGAIPEIIQNNVNGFLVDEINSENLSVKIDEVIKIMTEQPELWAEICCEARKRAEFFNIRKYVEELSLYIQKI